MHVNQLWKFLKKVWFSFISLYGNMLQPVRYIDNPRIFIAWGDACWFDLSNSPLFWFKSSTLTFLWGIWLRCLWWHHLDATGMAAQTWVFGVFCFTHKDWILHARRLKLKKKNGLKPRTYFDCLYLIWHKVLMGYAGITDLDTINLELLELPGEKDPMKIMPM